MVHASGARSEVGDQGVSRAPPKVRELFAAERVRARIAELGATIACDLADEVRGTGRPPLFLVIAEGARRFADSLLAAAATHGLIAESMIIRARRTERQELVAVAIEPFDERRCHGRAVILVDDIADEGRTLEALRARVTAARPASLRTAVLVSKHARRRAQIALDWVGFEVADGWIVGFGMDLDGKLRELDWIGVIED